MDNIPSITIRRPENRRGSIMSTLLPESLSLPPMFLSTSPIAREILQDDIDDENNGDEPPTSGSDSDSDSGFDHETRLDAEDAKLAFHPTGVAFGCGFSSVSLPGVDRPVPNPHEIEESFRAEVNLLRDNDILPPKQSQTRHGSVVDRVYHHMFSGDDVPSHETSMLPGSPAETSPLLMDHDMYGPQTPLPRDVHKIWEEAVAAHRVNTTWQREAKTLIGYSAPLIATFLLHYSVTIGSVVTVGRLGMLELAAVNRRYRPFCTTLTSSSD